jgi:hypothetical protein
LNSERKVETDGRPEGQTAHVRAGLEIRFRNYGETSAPMCAERARRNACFGGCGAIASRIGNYAPGGRHFPRRLGSKDGDRARARGGHTAKLR